MAATAASVGGVLARHRGWFRAIGVAWIVLGILAIALPLAASIAIEQVVGVLIRLGGIGQAAHAFRLHGWGGRVLALILGILYACAGLVLLVFPLQGLFTLTLVLAACLLGGGLAKVVLAFRLRPDPGWGGFLLSGLLGGALGVMLWLGLPSTAAWAIGTLVGIDLIFGGFAVWGVVRAVPSGVAA
jgi:uncharacterized membrane protein HdeD (DUF308 family)